MQTYEAFAEQAGLLAAAGKQFVADHRDEITGEASEGSRSAGLIKQLVDLLPALEMAVIGRAGELAPPAVLDVQVPAPALPDDHDPGPA